MRTHLLALRNDDAFGETPEINYLVVADFGQHQMESFLLEETSRWIAPPAAGNFGQLLETVLIRRRLGHP